MQERNTTRLSFLFHSYAIIKRSDAVIFVYHNFIQLDGNGTVGLKQCNFHQLNSTASHSTILIENISTSTNYTKSQSTEAIKLIRACSCNCVFRFISDSQRAGNSFNIILLTKKTPANKDEMDDTRQNFFFSTLCFFFLFSAESSIKEEYIDCQHIRLLWTLFRNLI